MHSKALAKECVETKRNQSLPRAFPSNLDAGKVCVHGVIEVCGLLFATDQRDRDENRVFVICSFEAPSSGAIKLASCEKHTAKSCMRPGYTPFSYEAYTGGRSTRESLRAIIAAVSEDIEPEPSFADLQLREQQLARTRFEALQQSLDEIGAPRCTDAAASAPPPLRAAAAVSTYGGIAPPPPRPVTPDDEPPASAP